MRIYCYGCSATVAVDEHAMEPTLRAVGWSVDAGKTYCQACAQARSLTSGDANEVEVLPAQTPPPAAQQLAPPIVRDPSAPDRAARARIGAAILDSLLLFVLARLVLLVIGYHVDGYADGAKAAGILLLLGIAYHTVFEANGGQTPGKRYGGVRVVAQDGGPLTLKAVALRSGFRVIDSIPILYASGLLNMLLSGPSRRQRLGDRVAGTLVVPADGRTLPPSSPWTVPLCAAVSMILAGGMFLAVASAQRDAAALGTVSGLPASDSTDAPPTAGAWMAEGVVLRVKGYALERVGTRFTRAWLISHDCSSGACVYVVTRQTSMGASTGELVSRPDGWHVSFPVQANPCDGDGDGEARGPAAFASEHVSWVVRFSPTGRSADVVETNYSRPTSICAPTQTLVRWHSEFQG